MRTKRADSDFMIDSQIDRMNLLFWSLGHWGIEKLLTDNPLRN